MTRREKEAPPRVVVNTSVVIAGRLSSRGASNALIELWRQGKFQWIISEDILEEIIEKLVEKGISEERVEAFIL